MKVEMVGGPQDGKIYDVDDGTREILMVEQVKNLAPLEEEDVFSTGIMIQQIAVPIVKTKTKHVAIWAERR